MKLVRHDQNIFSVTGLLTADECVDLIRRGEELGFHKASVRTASGPMMRPEVRDNDRAEFTDAKLAAELWRRCHSFVPSQLDEGIPIGLDENFRLYRYDIGQRFKRHKDGLVKRSPTVWSRLSCLFYLNGGFTGGETVFYSNKLTDGIRLQNMIVRPETGDALFFLHELWHEGRELIAGRKYVLRSDVFYRFPDGERCS